MNKHGDCQTRLSGVTLSYLFISQRVGVEGKEMSPPPRGPPTVWNYTNWCHEYTKSSKCTMPSCTVPIVPQAGRRSIVELTLGKDPFKIRGPFQTAAVKTWGCRELANGAANQSSGAQAGNTVSRLILLGGAN